MPALKGGDFARVLSLLNNQTTAAGATAKAAVAAVTQSPTVAPMSRALYKAAAAALTREGLEGEALTLLARGYSQGQLSEAALGRAYDGVLWALRNELGDDGTRCLRVVDAVSKGRVRPTDGGYVPLLEALGERGEGAAAAEVIYAQVLLERVGPDPALAPARKSVVFGLGMKYLVERRVDAGRLLALKREMEARGVPVVGVHWGLLAEALAGQGKVALCLALLQDECARGNSNVTSRVVTAALVGLLRFQSQQQQGGEQLQPQRPVWEAAVRLLSLLGAMDHRPTSYGVTAAVLIFGRAGMWPLALRVFDEGLWWDTIPSSVPVPRACDAATLNGAMEVLPPLNQDDEGSGDDDATTTALLRLFGPALYRRGMAAGLTKGWQKKQTKKAGEGDDSGSPLRAPAVALAGGPRRVFKVDLHEHSVRMALYGALPDAFRSLRLLQEEKEHHQQPSQFPREVHIVTGHGTGRGRYRGLAPHHKPPPTEDVGVLSPGVRRWLERRLPQGKVYEVSLGCVGVEAEALRRALPALLASVS